jgi:glycine cleavage system H protein
MEGKTVNPRDRKYSSEHEWAKLEGNKATIGITDYAQQQLGDVVFVELPTVGSEVRQFSAFGVVESVKAASDLFSPLSGKVLRVNAQLVDSPELVNRDPYEAGWMVEIETDDASEVGKLMSAEEYDSSLPA